MCGPLAGLSGGDVHALRLVEHWNSQAPGSAVLIAPETIRANLPPGVNPVTQAISTPLDRWLRGLVSYAAVVVLRTFAALVHAPRATVAIAASHFFHDVIPVVAHRLRFRSRPVAYVYHLVADMQRGRSLRSLLSRMAERFSIELLRRAGALLFVDNLDTRESLARLGIAPELIVPTKNAYDPPVELAPRAEPERPMVLFAGRFTEEKGVWDMLEVAREAPYSTVTMIGDGPLRAEVLERVRHEGIENVDVPGYVSEEEKWRLLRSATVFAAPSREEGWGIAVGEALTAGLPVVAYDLPAYRHVGNLPLRIPPGDVQLFVEAVTELLTHPAQLRRELERVRAGADCLPRWSSILSREIEAIGAGT
jgi:glycosyltransferase involved in cell wall biosynthesis